MIGTILLAITGVLIGAQIWRGLRIVLSQTVHRFQSYDDITKPYSQRYREGAERLTSGRYVGKYEGASQGRYAIKFGRQLLGLSGVALIGWLILLWDTLQNGYEAGTLSMIGLFTIFIVLGIITVVDYLDHRNSKLRRLR